MQTLFVAAGMLALITSVVHSVLGEWLIFRHLRNGTWVPALGAPPLRERNIRILWATWHLASVFGWAFACILIWLGFAPPDQPLKPIVVNAIVLAFLGGSILVLIGTKGKHPGWIALLLGASCWHQMKFRRSSVSVSSTPLSAQSRLNRSIRFTTYL